MVKIKQDTQFNIYKQTKKKKKAEKKYRTKWQNNNCIKHMYRMNNEPGLEFIDFIANE